MNWIGVALHPRMVRPPVWKSVTGDQVTSTTLCDNPVNKRLKRCFRKPVSPCGNARIGRLLPIMGVSSGQGSSELRLNSQLVQPRQSSSQWEKAGIDWALLHVQHSRASFGRQC